MRSNTQNVVEEIKYFDQVGAGGYDTISPEEFDTMYSYIKKYKLQGLVLDAGCGAGSFGKRLISKNSKVNVTGVDINAQFIEQINKAKIKNYQAICANLEVRSLFSKNQFDFILFPYVLHHFPDIAKVIRNAHFWLKKNGRIIILDPNGSNLILKVSYMYRSVMFYLFPSKAYLWGSVNEKHIPVSVFEKNLIKQFQILEMKTFSFKAPNIHKGSFVGFLIDTRSWLLRTYSRIPYVKYSGSDLFIVCKKK